MGGEMVLPGPLEWAAVGAFAAATLVVLWAWLDSARFPDRVPEIESDWDLEEFKRLAARNMNGALVVIGLSVLGGGWRRPP